MSHHVYQERDLTPQEILEYIRYMGAPNIKEIKTHFKTNSASVRPVLGLLMYKKKVIPMGGYMGAVHWIPTELISKGRPSVKKIRAAAREKRS